MQGSQNKEFRDRLQTNEGFSKKMKEISLKFQQIQQLAHYSLPSQSNQKMIVSLKRGDGQWWQNSQQDAFNIEIVVANKLPRGGKCIQNMLLNISILIPRPTHPFSFIFINTLADSTAYSDFKKALEYLPLQYLVQLQKIYVLHLSFTAKAYDFIAFDYVANYIKNKTIYYDSFEKLAEDIGMNYWEILRILPIENVSEFSKREQFAKIYLESIKQNESNSLSRSLLKQGEALQNKQNKASHKQVSKNIEDYEVGKTGAPLIIELLIYYFDKGQNYLSTEGLFRKSANIEQETALMNELASQNYQCLETINNPHLVANAIKRFLTKLKEPLVPYRYFDLLMKANSQGRKEILLQMINQLQNNRKMSLLLLIEFFIEKLFPRGEENLMNKDNMSVVIGPCLMWAEIPSISDLIYAQKIVGITLILLNDFDDLFGDRVERLKLVRNSVWSQQKDHFKDKIGNLQEYILSPNSQLSKLLNNNANQKADTLTEEQIQNLEETNQLLDAFHKK